MYKYRFYFSLKVKLIIANRRNPSGCGVTIDVTPFVGLRNYRLNGK